MSETLDITADPFLQLLTDALRAGPGSPEWHQAVSRLRTGGEKSGDEYQLLITAREHLESGRTYREIRPGPGFTRKVMANLDAEPALSNRSSLPLANIIAIGGAIVVLAVLGLIGFWLLRGAPATPGEDLSNVYFATTVSSFSFDSSLPGDWRRVGPLPVDPAHGLRPTTAPATGYDGGGIVTTTGIIADQPFAVETTFRVQHVTEDVIPQVFVTDQPDFSTDRATSPHELVWLIRDGRAKVVLPNGQFAGESDAVKDGQILTVRIVVGRESGQVVSGRRTLWSGPSQLAAGNPRYVGVRFLRRAGDKKDRDAVTVQSIKVMK